MDILNKKNKEKLFLGIDIGGTTIKAGAVSPALDLIAIKSIPTPVEADNNQFAQSLIAFIGNFISDYPQISSIGAGIPGVVGPDGTVRISPNIKALNNLPLKSIIKSNFDLPIAVDNDANAAAYAELQAGAGRNRDNFIYATLGTGIGGAIIINKQIFRGDNGGAGEIGHTIIDFNSILPKQRSFRNGILETFAGKNAIIALAKSILPQYKSSVLNKTARFDVIDISEAVSKSDAAAIECFRQTGNLIGAGFASAMNLLDITLIVVGGGISNAHPLLFDAIIDAIKDKALPTIAANAEIKIARFGDKAGIIGAALLGMNLK